MAIFCSHCGTKLEDFMKFCYNCGNPPTGISTAPVTRKPKVEYEVVELHWDKKRQPLIEKYERASKEQAIERAQPAVLALLKPYFDEGWQLDGTFSSAVNLTWLAKGTFSDMERLIHATARLIRYS